MLQFGQLFLFNSLSCDLIGLVVVLVILLLLIGLFFPIMHLKNDIMMAEVFIIYAPVPFSVQCSPTVFVLSTRDLAVILEDVPGLLPLLRAVQKSRMRSRERSGRRPGYEANVSHGLMGFNHSIDFLSDAKSDILGSGHTHRVETQN